MHKSVALLALLFLPLPGVGPAAAAPCNPGDTQDPVLRGLFMEPDVALSTAADEAEDWSDTFLIEATVEDDFDTVLVWLEFVEVDTGWNFTIVLGNKTVLPGSPTGVETSKWSAQVSKWRRDIVVGQYDVTVRVHDACQNVWVSEEGKFDYAIEAGDGEYPDPVYPDQPSLRLAGFEDGVPDPMFLGPGAFLQAEVTMGRLRAVTYAIEYAPGQFTEPEVLQFPYVVGQDILLPGIQTVVFKAHSRLPTEGTLTLTVPNVIVDRDPPEITKVKPMTLDGNVYRNIPFTLQVSVEDIADHSVRVRAVGNQAGSQVSPFDGDVGQPLIPLPGATIRYLDTDGNLSLTDADVLVLDTDVPGARLTPGDVRLTGFQPGYMLTLSDFPDSARPALTTPGQRVDIRFIDTDGNGYDVGDLVVLDDTRGIGVDERVLSTYDVWFSGDRFGKWAQGHEIEDEIRPLKDGAPTGFWLLDNDGDGVPSQGDAVYLSNGDRVAAGDVRIVPGFRGVDLVASSTDPTVFNPVTDTYTFPNVVLPDARTYRVVVSARDVNGNEATHVLTLPVNPGYTKIRVTDLKVLNKTALPGEAVQFTATMNQTEGVGTVNALVSFEAGGKTGVRAADLRVRNTTQVAFNDTYLPGRHTMDVEVAVPEGIDVRTGSDLTRSVQFEVFLGRVDYGTDSYYIRVNTRGLAGSAVLNPGPSEEVFDLYQKQIPTQNGTRTVWAFNTTAGKELAWDPLVRDAQGRPVTVITDEPETKGRDSPGLTLVVLLVAVAVLAWRRRD